jgi:hypothetical protein
LPRDSSPVTLSPFLSGTKPTWSQCDVARKLQPTHSCFHIHIVSLAAQEELAIAQLASPLAYFFISPKFSPVPPFLSSIFRTLYHAVSDTSSHMHVHACVLPLSSYTLSSVEWIYVDWCWFGNRNSGRDDRSCPEEEEVRPWCARWSCSLRTGNARLGYIKCPR